MSDLITPQGRQAVSAILFDKDGTLLEFVSLWGVWSKCLLERFSAHLNSRQLTLQPETIPSLFGTVHNEDGNITDYDRNGPLAMGTMADLYAILAWQGYLQGLSWAETMEIVDLCRKEADAMMDEMRPVVALPGLARFLEEARSHGVPMAVVTADETDAAEKHLRWLGIRDYFSEVIGTDQVERGKPFPDMVQLACSRLGIDPSGVVVIGDTNGDMRMAKAAGAALAIGLPGSASDDEATNLLSDAHVIVRTYEDLSVRRPGK
ncbi:HAD family hydrolase [Paenibacillus sp. NPDC057934]|uniref:HAD family hydrolase n=1 Tax=Paenibacillus sp. NPDC057934 TaxID=3346282 RepID=UPI0036DBD20A